MTDLETVPPELLVGEGAGLDTMAEEEAGATRNRAKVGSARPSSLLYTYGPGAIMDLPNFAVMPTGLDDWEVIYRRLPALPLVSEPRMLELVRHFLGRQVTGLRAYPWQPKRRAQSTEGADLGIQARVFPQWLRCTGCDLLGPLTLFGYENTHPYRPDLAQFTHDGCPGRRRPAAARGQRGGAGRRRRAPAVPAQHLLTCVNGHLDEFPYDLWVHRGRPCPQAPIPDLKMRDNNLGKSVGSRIECTQCGAARGMSEAQGPSGQEKLPQRCRGRHPHLDAFDPECDETPVLIMMGSSKLWFAATQSVIVMPRDDRQERTLLAAALVRELGEERLRKYAGDLETLRDVAEGKVTEIAGADDRALEAAVAEALAPDAGRSEEAWDPYRLLVPEWAYLQRSSLFAEQPGVSGLSVTEKPLSPALAPGLARVVAVNRMKKVNAVLGFTRLDQLDRVADARARLVSMVRDPRRLTWVPATEDRGEGVFLQLDEAAVADWESRIPAGVWTAYQEAHRRNFRNRYSETAGDVDHLTRLPGPRYWLVHTLAHLLIREMAMSCGYPAASLSERLYAWPAGSGREAAAGLLICTTSSDSEGTLGGLVALAEPDRLAGIVRSALRRASRCSSDPVCAQRVPREPEDFLHGAACHCCVFVSETSCERANRFLDRRFLLTLPVGGGEDRVAGFFGDVDVR